MKKWKHHIKLNFTNLFLSLLCKPENFQKPLKSAYWRNLFVTGVASIPGQVHILPGRIFEPPYLSCLFSWAALKSSCMFLVICSVFRMTSSVLGRTGLGAVWASAVSGTEPSPCHTILLCLPFLLDLWTLQKWLKAIGAYWLLLCF